MNNTGLYLNFKNKQEKEFNNFTKGKIFICFSDDDLNEKAKEKNIKNFIYIGLSIFIDVKYYNDYINLCKKQKKELKNFIFSNEKLLKDILIYEFYNYENYLNSGYYDTLKYNLYFSDDDLKKYNNTIKTAIKEYEKEAVNQY